MRTLRLTIAYDGTDYAGWQVQRSRTPTIQGTLQETAARILQQHVVVVASGRTDAGVHALGQVAHLRTASRLACASLQRALNALLPDDIVVLDVREVAPQFHARFLAVSKHYRYRLVNGPVVPPFVRRYVHQVVAPLNVRLMRREARALLGRHDFRSFHKSDRVVVDAVRQLWVARIVLEGDELAIDLVADGFLQGMGRAIAGTLIEIGRGRLPPGSMRRILRAKDRRAAGPTAPARGLCLMRVGYRPIRRDPEAPVWLIRSLTRE